MQSTRQRVGPIHQRCGEGPLFRFESSRFHLPGSPALGERTRWVVAVKIPADPPLRLTLTLPALTGAANIYVLVAGSQKARVLRRADWGSRPEHLPSARRPIDRGSVGLVGRSRSRGTTHERAAAAHSLERRCLRREGTCRHISRVLINGCPMAQLLSAMNTSSAGFASRFRAPAFDNLSSRRWKYTRPAYGRHRVTARRTPA
ncbi:MAG: hypothetical protein GEU82_12095 [Luteitalea sp.]|nr:hypothetical protein [Luteitalea sp.]